ncbi:Ger(x)C family spore germination protein [Brevibacillus ruminantium]|uniref:Ger(X)C family spore germination protein n=1 Tax=Brevibacillus ruminantium TaxID=2950604 RepID=A0ABY4WKC2_9BACL|nr:Ger(x)C family spore germination protein [Brevibacillus ruminantium]USG66310.1 Ger(x)C family spore germination protein [Brevibacillus ruminantium]
MRRCRGERYLRREVWLILLALLMTGCVKTEIFDDLGLMTVSGYDLLNDDRIYGTAVIPTINPEAKEKVQILSGESMTTKGFRDKANLQSDKEMVSGQLRVVMYNVELAKKGVGNLVDTLYRDPSVGSRVYLCVFDGLTKDLLSTRFEAKGNVGMYLYRMIEHNVEQDKIPSPTLHEFIRTYFGEGIDPYLPLLEKKGKNVGIKGVALFRDDKYVDWVPPKEAFFIKLVHENYRTATYEMRTSRKRLELEPNSGGDKETDFRLVFDTISSKASIKVVSQKPLIFDVKIKLKARILEMSEPVKLENPKMTKQLDKVLSENLKQELEKVVRKIQKMGVDPFGFGERYRSQVRGAGKLSHEELQKRFQEAEFRFHVDAEVIRNGVMD